MFRKQELSWANSKLNLGHYQESINNNKDFRTIKNSLVENPARILEDPVFYKIPAGLDNRERLTGSYLGARLVGSYIREAKLVGSCTGSYQKGKLVGSCTTILQK